MNTRNRFNDLVELFDYLSEEEGALVDYQAGETIYKQGQPDNRIYMVKEGGISQSKRNRSGEVMTYQILKPGDILSTYRLSANVVNQPCRAKALLDSKLQQVLRVSFRERLLDNPELAIKIVDLISEELQTRDKTLERQIYMTAKQRIFSILEDLSELVEEEEDGKHIGFLTRKELADMAGMTEETATRSLSKLEQEGRIRKKGNEIVLV